jgi:hypothetical protein
MRVFGFRNDQGEDVYFAKAGAAKAAAKSQAIDQEAYVAVYAYETIKATTSEVLAQALNFGANEVEGLGDWQNGKRKKIANVSPRPVIQRAKRTKLAPARGKAGKPAPVAKGKPAAKPAARKAA